MYHVREGSLQPMVVNMDPFFLCHYGPAQYDRDKPILTESLREQGQSVCDRLNAGEISEEEAEVLLSKI